MVRRRRNKIALWEWSPSGEHRDRESGRRERGKRSAGRDALGAALLLGALIFILSKIPDRTPGYDRGRLASYMCESAGVDPGTLQCVGVTIAGWFAIVVTIGIVLKIARMALGAVGIGRGR